MVMAKNPEQALSWLINQNETEILVGEYLITMRVFDSGTKLTFSTAVYVGEKHIPLSVRGCLFDQFPEQTIKTYLSIDESTYSVNLHYIGMVENMDKSKFKDLLEEFAGIADLWRNWLDDHDRREYAYVRR